MGYNHLYPITFQYQYRKLFMKEQTHQACHVLEYVTTEFTRQSKEFLGSNLVGIYLHGSAAMGCFHEENSDIDLLVVINTPISDDIKRRFMDMVVELNAAAPKKGIEMSVIRAQVCKPFVYPTPYELHFSNAHLEWYQTNPMEYIAKMNGVDRDLAAHVTITYHRGRCLYGKDIKAVFDPVKREYYLDSIWYDVADAKETIFAAPTYMILNLCRVLAYQRDGVILSKKEGGEWGLLHVLPKYRSIVEQALLEYTFGVLQVYDADGIREYAGFMLDAIKESVDG